MKFHIQNQSALPNSFPIFFPAPLVVTALVAAPVIFSPSGIQIIAPVSTGTGTTFDPFATFPQIQVIY